MKKRKKPRSENPEFKYLKVWRMSSGFGLFRLLLPWGSRLSLFDRLFFFFGLLRRWSLHRRRGLNGRSLNFFCG